MTYLSVIRPQAGQITQPQSRAFLHGVDWMWSILTGGLCRLTRGWFLKRNRTLLDLLGLRKVGSFITHLRSSYVVPSGDSAWGGRSGRCDGRYHNSPPLTGFFPGYGKKSTLHT
ncbi:hypothetical protein AVEN_264742-1 [Araneus ventricosus]|uniref:Uncharacterized protein n=1 Tax=Araneus ventricosus TaxID=182803 RepID=A0A4Y2EGB0_ARAVE|nr:hypothetical protein AVEN_264742-1 [Araneus ventricosus]